MDIIFEDDDLDRLEWDAKFTAKLSPALVKAYRKKIQALRAAHDERDLYSQRSNNYEEIQSRKGHYSIRLNDQYRLVFRYQRESRKLKTVVIEGIEDYH